MVMTTSRVLYTGMMMLQVSGSAQVTISMATLQGYFLRHKDDAVAAMECIPDLLAMSKSNSKANLEEHHLKNSASPELSAQQSRGGNAPPRNRRPLTIAEIDRMPFNPQPGWDASL